MRRALRLIGVAALAAAPVAGLSLLTAAPALAHDQLVGSTPEEGGTVATPLTSVELVFSAAIPSEFVQVAVTDAAGTNFVDGAPQTVGDTVTQAVTQLPDGQYTIAYRVVSSDGHPIDGTITFSVTGVGPGEPASTPAAPAAEPPPTPPDTTSTTEPPRSEPSDYTTPAAGTGDSSGDGGLGTTAIVALAAGGAVVVALLAFWAAGGRRSGAAEDTDS